MGCTQSSSAVETTKKSEKTTEAPRSVEAEAKPLTPEDVVGVLKGRGWEAEIVEESSVTALIKTSPHGLMKCVDGRP
eukprot:13013612-Ditylum_brightwellii.AAC.1